VTDIEPDESDDTAGPDAADRAREGVEHLQSAARELIAAARAALDVAEDLFDDPDMAASMAGAVGSLGDMLRNVTSSWRAGRNGETGHGPDDADRGDDPPDPGVERITVR
jgi:hypothetical protein